MFLASSHALIISLQQAAFDMPPLEGEVMPFAARTITLPYMEYVALKSDAAYWKAQHERVIVREEVLKEQLKHKEAIIRDLNQRLYGKHSEKGGSKADASSNDKRAKSKRSRGQQKGTPGPGRTKRPNLPVIPEIILLSETACGLCGLEYSLLSSYEESDIIEVEVAAHIRRIKRQKCVKNCTCESGSKISTAPVIPKLIPGSPYGNSVWGEILLKKFLHAQPVNRTLNDFRSLGLDISPGTIAGGLQKLTPLFTPIYKAFHQQQMIENKFHNDETRWEVYEQVEGKTGHRWYLWVMRSVSVVFYRMDPTRSNNSAEQAMRNPVLGRNNYYGSGSLWSAELAAMQFSIFQTILLWGINPRTWLRLYLEACAQNKGIPPADLSEFLPWNMSEARLLQLTKPENNTS